MNKNLLTYAALIVTMLFWGLSFIGTKIALSSFTPFVSIFLRFSLASVFFLIVLFRNGLPRLSSEQHRKLLLTALFQPGLYFAFETIGLTHTTASNASIILALVPIAVLVLAHFILEEEISTRNLLGIILSVIGIIILVLGGVGGKLSFEGSLLGDLLILGAVFSAAIYMVLARDLGKTLSSMQITGFQVLYGTIIFAPFFLYNLPEVKWAEASLESYAALAFLALFCTITAFLAYNFALTKIEASRASVFINGIPVVTAVGAWFILGEKLTWVQIAGGALVLLAVFITSIRSKTSDLSSEGLA